MTPRSILIVDDEANQRLMVEQALRAVAFDWTISTAASGPAAVSARCAASPAAVNPSRWTATPTPAEVMAPSYRGFRYTASSPETFGGETVSTGGSKVQVACRGARGLVKTGKKNNSERQRVRSRRLNSGRDRAPGSRPRPWESAI